MHLLVESSIVEQYLCEDEVVNYSHDLVQETVCQLQSTGDETERIRETFEFVRDTFPHSWDIQSPHVTCKASEVLQYGTGICYAKAHLLAALLRAQGIPTGFCYQSLLRDETSETTYVIHGLNAVYLSKEARWVRLDARGNKPGIQAEFSTTQEKLAFPIRPELGEIDYPTIFVHPHPKTVRALQAHTDSLSTCWPLLPDRL